MQAKATHAKHTSSPAHGPGSPVRASLAAQHPDALYQFVPPVACDEEGYPYEDSAVSEGDRHFRLMCDLRQAAELRFEHSPAVVIRSDMALYFEEGSRAAVVVPDLFVAYVRTPGGVERSYRVWEEGGVPAFVLEITSKDNWRQDADAKRRLYEDLRIGEYWIIDLTGRLAKPITGLRLAPDGVYREIEERPSGGLLSEVLGLELLMQDGECRMRDPQTGDVVPTFLEAHAAQREAESAQREAESRRRQAEAAREAAEARVAELERRLANAEGR
ncbi:MAG: Uma2 family endonuclease [Gammaproteobacteria bacterium]|nr:Uma2 family endonuclease [Gammaproteobacteria bacterium]